VLLDYYAKYILRYVIIYKESLVKSTPAGAGIQQHFWLLRKLQHKSNNFPHNKKAKKKFLRAGKYITLFSSGLYRRFRNYTESCQKACGLSPPVGNLTLPQRYYYYTTHHRKMQQIPPKNLYKTVLLQNILYR